MRERERELLERARAGCEEAFTELVRLHQGAVRAYLGRHARERELVDDLAQEVFVAAYRGLSGYGGESALRLWLLGIARNQWRLYLRGEIRRRERQDKRLALELARWRSARVAEEQPEQVERELSALERCLAGLPARSRELVEAHYFDGLAAAEIARRTGRKPSAVRMTLLRVRQRLRGCVERRLGAGAG